MDEEGWLHSGDVGEWLNSGTLRIIDRKKKVFKLSQGEYVAPDRLEDIIIKGSSFISQVRTLCICDTYIYIYKNVYIYIYI